MRQLHSAAGPSRLGVDTSRLNELRKLLPIHQCSLVAFAAIPGELSLAQELEDCRPAQSQCPCGFVN